MVYARDRIRLVDHNIRGRERACRVPTLHRGDGADVAGTVHRLGLAAAACTVHRGVLLGGLLLDVQHLRSVVAHRRLGLVHHRQGLVVDLHRRGAVVGRRLAGRDHGRDRLTGVEHPARGQWLIRPGHLLLGQVGGDDDIQHPGHGAGRRSVDRLDLGAGQVAEHELDVQEARQLQVGGEPGGSRDLLPPLQAAGGGPDHAHPAILACSPS